MMKTCFTTSLWLLISVAMPLLLTGCDRYARERSFVEAVGAGSLTNYVAELERKDSWKAVHGQLPKEMWHEAFARQGVLQVKQYFGGVQIVLERRGRNERGVYIPADQSKPEDGSGVHFQTLASGIYWFEQKNRPQYIPPEQRNAGTK